MSELGTLGEHVADTLERDRVRREQAIAAAQRALFNEHADQGRRQPLLRAWVVVGAMALAATAMLVARVAWPESLEFRVDGATGSKRVWLAAPTTKALRVDFSDGSSFEADPSTRLRVLETSSTGAEIALENGSIRAQVAHTGHSSWRVTAGPFTVRVTGTQFVVKWNPASQVFALAVTEGSVVVSGSVAGSAWPVRAGDKMQAFIAEGRVEFLPSEKSVVSETRANAHEEQAEPATSTPLLAAPTPTDTAPRSKTDPDWRVLARSGDLKKAYAAAELSGFKTACSTSSAAELLVLGDAARLAGRADRAREALLALRQRFPGDSRRAAAAFALGKVAFDGRAAYREAAVWFTTSIREAPGGPLAREAAGRRIEALRRAGELAAARAAASDYLASYPDGPHADMARTILR